MENTIVFYLTFGTIPSLFSEISIFLDDRPSYLFVRSSGDFNPDAIKNLKHVLGYHKFTGGDKDYIEDQYSIVKEKILEAKKRNKNSRFIVYIDDSRVQFYLKPFIEANALDDISNLIIISEGSSSKYMYYDLQANDEIECEKKWNNLIENYEDSDSMIKIDNYAFWLSTQKNVEYQLPYYQKFNNPKVSAEYRAKMNLTDLSVETIYNKLTDEQKKYIFDFNSISINHKDKYLVLIGTYNFGSNYITTAIVENFIDQLGNKYDDYKLLYKSHPLFPVDGNPELVEYLNKKNISILPAKIPVEILLWEYNNISIGGFSSSVVSLIDPSRVKFIFGQPIGYNEILFDNIETYDYKLSAQLAVQLLNDRYSLVDDHRAHYLELLEINKNLSAEISELRSRLDKMESDINSAGLSKKVSSKIKRLFKK